MILVTVATHNQGFKRLVKAMDDIAGQIDERVVMQIGATAYTPRHAEYFKFASQKEMENLNRKARLVVTHAGAGSIITALKLGKPLVLMPRLSKYMEIMDDHQLELADVIAAKEKAVVVHEVNELPNAIKGPFPPSKSLSVEKQRLISALRDCLA